MFVRCDDMMSYISIFFFRKRFYKCTKLKIIHKKINKTQNKNARLRGQMNFSTDFRVRRTL